MPTRRVLTLLAFAFASKAILAAPALQSFSGPPLNGQNQWIKAATARSEKPDPARGATFTAVFTGMNTSNSWAAFTFDKWPSPFNSCKIIATVKESGVENRKMSLHEDNGDLIGPGTVEWISWMTGGGDATVHQNSHCRLYKQGSSISLSGGTATVVVNIEFLEPYSGEWYPYIVAEADLQNWPGNGGWGVGLYSGGIVPKLQITSPKANPETAVAIQNKRGAPVSADAPGSTNDVAKRRNYKARFRDWNGKRSLIQAHYIIGRKGANYGHEILPADKCQVILHPHANLVELAGDQSGAGLQVIGSPWALTLFNSNCTLYPGAITGQNMDNDPHIFELELPITLRTGLQAAGTEKEVHLATVDDYYNNGQAWTTTWSGPKGTGRIILNGSEPQPSYTVDVAPDKRPVFRGRQTTFNAVIRPANGYSGTLSLTTAGLPAGTTATFNPQQVSVLGQEVTSTLTITANPPNANPPALEKTTFEVIAETPDGQDRSMAMATLDVVDLDTVNRVGPGGWEAASAVSKDSSPGGFNWWTHVWKESFQGSVWTANWNGSWVPKEFGNAVVPSTPLAEGDPNLAWDGQRKWMFLTALSGTPESNLTVNLWYLSQDQARAEDGKWNYCGPVFSPDSVAKIAWDYPSIAIAADGRVIVGAARIANPSTPQQAIDGYYVKVSSPPHSICPQFSSEADLTPVDSNGNRIPSVGLSRVAAAGNSVMAFIQQVANGQSPVSIRKRELVGSSWDLSVLLDLSSQQSNVADTAGSVNNPANGQAVKRIGYAPSVAVSGNATGVWAAAFAEKVNFINLLKVCSNALAPPAPNTPPCALITQDPVDQFLPGLLVTESSILITYFRRTSGYPAPVEARIAKYTLASGIASPSTPSISTVMSALGPLVIDTGQWENFDVGSAKCPALAPLLACNILGDYNAIAGTTGELTFPFVSAQGSQEQSFLAVPQ